MDTLKQILNFFILCFAIVGVFGGIGYALYCKAYFIAFCIGLVAWLAYPRIKQSFEILIGNNGSI